MYVRKTRPKFISDAFILLALITGVLAGAAYKSYEVWAYEQYRANLISPLADHQIEYREVTKPLCEGEKCEIEAYIVKVFKEDALDAFNVLKCENGSLNPRAINYNADGSVDRGIFQLNSRYWGGEENFDYKTNIDKAYQIFLRAGKKWTPWSCSHRVFQKNYLGN